MAKKPGDGMIGETKRETLTFCAESKYLDRIRSIQKKFGLKNRSEAITFCIDSMLGYPSEYPG